MDDTVYDWQNKATYPNLDFVLCVGDATHASTYTGWRKYTQGFTNLVYLPQFFIFGNHDGCNYYNATYATSYPWKGYEDGKNATGTMLLTYAFIYNNVLFIVLGDEGDESIITDWQREFLEKITSLYPDKTTVIFSHNTVNDTTQKSGTGHSYRCFQNTTWWWNFLHSNPQIKLFVHGHNHAFDAVKKGNVVWVQADSLDALMGEDNSDSIYVEIGETYILVKNYDAETENWDVSLNFTGYNNNLQATGFEKIIIPSKIQDGQTIKLYNHYIAENYKLYLVGTDNNELAYNKDFDYWLNDYYAYYFCGFYNDDDNFQDGVAVFNGADTMIASIHNQARLWRDGKVPYNMPVVVPGKTYEVRVKAKADATTADALDVKIHFLGKDVSSVISTVTPIAGADLTTSYQWFSGTFTAPAGAWLAQIEFVTYGSNTYYIDAYSIKPVGTSSYTEDFSLTINGETHTYTGTLLDGQMVTFTLNKSTMQNELQISASIGGNKVGIFMLVYENPLLFSDDATLGDNGDGSIYVKRTNQWCDKITIIPLDENAEITDTNEDTTAKGYRYYYMANADAPKYIHLNLSIPATIKPRLISCAGYPCNGSSISIPAGTPINLSFDWGNITDPVYYKIWIHSSDGSFNYTVTINHSEFLAGDHIEYVWGSKGEPALPPGRYTIRVKCIYRVGGVLSLIHI